MGLNNKILVTLIIIISLFLMSCEDIDKYNEHSSVAYSEKFSAIELNGKSVETAFLYTTYRDKGALIVNYGPTTDPCDRELVTDVTGTVNTRIPGVYIISYNAADINGRPLPVVTRTINVVENKAGFLNGVYNVVNTCTLVTQGLKKDIVSQETYTAIVNTGSCENEFELISLKIGREFVVPSASLNSNIIEVGYFSPDYAQSSASGTLSASKNTFTIESIFVPYAPRITYRCKNVYTKRTVLNNITEASIVR